MYKSILLMIFVQISTPIARDAYVNYEEKPALLVIKDPPLGYGKHEYDCEDVLRFPWVGTIAEPVFEVTFDQANFRRWNGRIKDLPLSLSEIRDQVIRVVNEQGVLRGSKGSVWQLKNVVLWSVSEEREHYLWVASFEQELSNAGQSHGKRVSLFFHLDGSLIKPVCIEGNERRFQSVFGKESQKSDR